MDPEPEPRNTNIIKFVPNDINRDRVYFEEIDGKKVFSLAHFNVCTHSLVTCQASFDGNYNLLSCNIDVNLLDSGYDLISENEDELPLDDLFIISGMLDNERLTLSYDGEKVLCYMIGDNYKVETQVGWILDYALKEDDFKFMDITDKMLEYLCTKVGSSRCYKSVLPFKRVENLYTPKSVLISKVMKKVG